MAAVLRSRSTSKERIDSGRNSPMSTSSQGSFASINSYSDFYKPEKQRKMYSTFVASGAEHVERALDLLSQEIQAGASVLEIGTRNGAILTALRGIVGPAGTVAGIAMGEKERRTALKDLIGKGLEGIQVFDRTPAWQAAGTHAVDGIIITYLLELLETEGVQHLLSECCSVLRPTGHLVVVSVTGAASSGPFRIPVLRPQSAGVKPINVRQLLESTGFSPDIVKSSSTWGWNVDIVLASMSDDVADCVAHKDGHDDAHSPQEMTTGAANVTFPAMPIVADDRPMACPTESTNLSLLSSCSSYSEATLPMQFSSRQAKPKWVRDIGMEEDDLAVLLGNENTTVQDDIPLESLVKALAVQWKQQRQVLKEQQDLLQARQNTESDEKQAKMLKELEAELQLTKGVLQQEMLGRQVAEAQRMMADQAAEQLSLELETTVHELRAKVLRAMNEPVPQDYASPCPSPCRSCECNIL